MKKLHSFICFALTALATLSLASCHSGDDDDNDSNNSEIKDLVSSKIPEEGWSGNATNGILTYTPDEDADSDEPVGYFSFKMQNGVCENGVYNVVMPNSAQARKLANMLKNGSWAEDEDFGFDDDDDYDYYDQDEYYYSKPRRGLCPKVFNFLTNDFAHFKFTNSTRSSLKLVIPVQQEGRNLYVALPNIKGLTQEELEAVMEYWEGYSYKAPDRVLFGTYENGTYKCSNLRGLDMTYVIDTKYDAQGYCTMYRTSITLPSKDWAELYYMQYQEQMDQLEQQFGRRPSLKKDGKTVIVDAIIEGDFTHEMVDQMVYTMDWMNNCPILFNLFN